MSKPLPPASGFPVKLVVRGEGGRDAEARIMAQDVRGELLRFVAAARQNARNLPAGQAVREISGGTARFIKNNGQEQLIVTMRPPAPPAPQPQRPEEPYESPLPDYCVVDIVYPGSEELEVRFLARGMSPERFRNAPFAEQLELDYPDSTPTYSADKEPGYALMQYARHAPAEGTIGITDRVASLLVDLREVPRGEQVEIELWGRYFLEEEEGDDDGEGPSELELELEIPYERVSTAEIAVSAAADQDDTVWYESAGRIGQPVFDPLGNLAPIEHTTFTTQFNLVLDVGNWDETELVPDDTFNNNTRGVVDAWGGADPPMPSATRPNGAFTTGATPLGPGGVAKPGGIASYIQRRYDETSGEMVARRRVTYQASGWATSNGTTQSGRLLVAFYVRELPVEGDSQPQQLDIVQRLYYGTPLEAYDTAHPDGARIWSLEQSVPQRTKIGEGSIESDRTEGGVEFTAGSGPLKKIGDVAVDRAGGTVTFTPA